MNSKFILDRLEMLTNLCDETESKLIPNNYLFNQHTIHVQEMIRQVNELHTGRQTIHVDNERDLLINIMKESNKIWRIRNKIKKGEWDGAEHTEMMEKIEDYLAQGSKINAIKYYREEMKTRFNDQVGLRESKDYIDEVYKDMKRRSICK
jgi:ribosomal protein L7/L12